MLLANVPNGLEFINLILKIMKKSIVLRTATAWSLEKIVDHYLNDASICAGGYINAKYRDVKITVEAKNIDYSKKYDSGK